MRGDVDDPAVLPLEHVAADLARERERPDQVGLDHLAVIGRRGVDDVVAMDDAGIVHEDVDAAVLAHEGADLSLHAFLVGDVEDHGRRLALLARDRLHGRVEVFRGTAGAQHRGAGSGEGDRHVASEAPRRAGHQRDAVLERKEVCHGAAS